MNLQGCGGKRLDLLSLAIVYQNSNWSFKNKFKHKIIYICKKYNFITNRHVINMCYHGNTYCPNLH